MPDDISVIENPVPEGGDLVDEIRAELRSAREVLSIISSEEGGANPPTPSLERVSHPRLHGMSSDQLEDHIERLERDLEDVEAGRFDGFVDGDETEDDDEMVDAWQLDVDGLFVGLAFRVSVETGATLVSSTCECPTDDCVHIEVAEARVRHRFAADTWTWEDERERLGLPDLAVSITDAPAQWSPSVETDDDDDTERQEKKRMNG